MYRTAVSAETPRTILCLQQTEREKDFALSAAIKQFSVEMSDTLLFYTRNAAVGRKTNIVVNSNYLRAVKS